MTVVLGVSARWPVWLWAVPAAMAVVLAGVLATARGPRPESGEPAWEKTRVVGVALPSRVPDYDFHFSATVWWRPVPNTSGQVHADPAGLAIETVLARAREVTERELPERLDLVQHRLNGVLGTQGLDRSALVEAMGGKVELRLSEDDRNRLGKLSEVRKTEEVWEHERRHEQSKRAYLGGDVLRSPGDAVVWWLARHDDQIKEAVDLIGPLAQLSAAANNEAVSDLYEHLLPLSGPFPDDDEDGTGDGGPPEPPSRPPVLGPLRDLLGDVQVPESSPEGKVYVHRTAELMETIGRPYEARLIRESLTDDGDAPPARGGPSAGDRFGVPLSKFDKPASGYSVDGAAREAGRDRED
ncbi:hypothetical protein [Streptomyces sp. NRRL WC-3742]|uniref:hypothetical protein n=1 Tax=Streptomyces sp. NRRL WC-3742 TaxID=1463934 RepID=UPI00131C6729|nr:hypothetical protein [Streptomyces sp. NRRL WC-3742]